MHRLHRAASGWIRRAATVARTHTAPRAVVRAAALAVAAIGTATAAQRYTLANEAAAKPCCHSAAANKQPAASGATALQLAQAELIALLGADRVSSEASDLTTHTSDAYSYHKSSESASGAEEAAGTLRGLVVYPLSTQEVSDIVKICVRHRVTMIPYGSGTSLEGQTSTTQHTASRVRARSRCELTSMSLVARLLCRRSHVCSTWRRVHRSFTDAVSS